VLQEEGKADEARSLLHQIIDYYQRFDPTDDSHLAKPLDLLGKDELARGNAAEAEGYLTRAVAIAKRVYQLDGFQTAGTEVDLAKVSLLKKDYAQADRILSEAVPNLLKQLSASPVTSARGQLAWGRALYGLKRYSEAEKEFSAAYKIYKTQGTSSAVELKETAMNLVSTYIALKRPADAEKLRSEFAAIGNPTAVTHR
jgi:tetratricopeptide (TPR) repeat protein